MLTPRRSTRSATLAASRRGARGGAAVFSNSSPARATSARPAARAGRRTLTLAVPVAAVLLLSACAAFPTQRYRAASYANDYAFLEAEGERRCTPVAFKGCDAA